MKKLVIILFISFWINATQGQCSIYGDKPVQKFQILDSLKNRNFTDSVDSSVTLENILLFTGDDTKNYSYSQYVRLKGYVVLVKYGGPETCNCHSKNKDDLDIHVELSLNPNDKGAKAMVVEINRYTRNDHPEFTLANIKKLIGKQVTVEGFMFFDEEHKQNAFTTNPDGSNLWRYTCWEVHPVMRIY
ncbi:hypothetical protein GALL_108850 [mine drainage metagenome]|uniref:Uncharacterized protein n=1 Tax=mine drainage metagenome TaxID=410659 RepID=A0A1J5SF74_9ZZZZ